MSKLQIVSLEIFIDAGQKKFNTKFDFESGINIISSNGKNTIGKSTCLNLILYGLGIEIILGDKGIRNLTPALKEQIEYNEHKYEVKNSHVKITVKNEKDEFLVVRRVIVGEKDARLMEVKYAKNLEDLSRIKEYSLYFIHDPQSATSEKGFYTFLSQFIGWDLPKVTKYNTKSSLLYIECIFPLFFIEQRKGWMDIQSTVPRIYQIKEVQKNAIEFVLNLDMSKIEKRRRELDEQLKDLDKQWRNLKEICKNLADNINGIIDGLSNDISALDRPILLVPSDDKHMIPLTESIKDIRVKLKNIKIQSEQKIIDYPEKEQQLKKIESDLFVKNAELNERKKDYYLELENKDELDNLINSLKNDLKKNQETKKLEEFSKKNLSVSTEICPTCKQSVKNILFDQNVDLNPMSLEENIKYIKQQIQTVKFLLDKSIQNIDLKSKLVNSFEDDVNLDRKKIRDIKTSIKELKSPDIENIRERLYNEEKLEKFIKIQELFEDKLIEFQKINETYIMLKDERKSIPNDVFSETDKKKIETLENIFKDIIYDLGFSSTKNDIFINKDTFRPNIIKYDITKGISATDGIRVIWAYTIALQRLSDVFKTNHLKISIFDEPGQQQIILDSLDQFYKNITKIDLKDNQIIIASSEMTSNLKEYLKDTKFNLIEFNDRILKPDKEI